MSTAASHEGPSYLEQLSEDFNRQFQAVADQDLRRVQTSPAGQKVELYHIPGVGTLSGQNIRPGKFMVRLSVQREAVSRPEGFYKDYQLACDPAQAGYLHKDVTPTTPEEFIDAPVDLPSLAEAVGRLTTAFVALHNPANPVAEVISINAYQ